MNPTIPKNTKASSESAIPVRTPMTSTRSFPEVETPSQANIPLSKFIRRNDGGVLQDELPIPTLVPSSGIATDGQLATIMRDIEKKTEQKLQNILAPVATASTMEKMEFIGSQGHDLGDKLIGIMSAGADEFKAKTGRNMTYSEMRSLYG